MSERLAVKQKLFCVIFNLLICHEVKEPRWISSKCSDMVIFAKGYVCACVYEKKEEISN